MPKERPLVLTLEPATVCRPRAPGRSPAQLTRCSSSRLEVLCWPALPGVLLQHGVASREAAALTRQRLL